MADLHRIPVKLLRETLDMFNEDDWVYLEDNSIKGYSTKLDKDLWCDVSTEPPTDEELGELHRKGGK